jgi:hypothetical protein
MDTLDLLAKSFELSCDMPHVTLVVVWNESVCGIDSWWKTEDQARVLEGLLQQDGIPVGWIGMDENLDPIAVVPLNGALDDELLEREILLQAHEAKTGRGIRWMRRNTEFLQPSAFPESHGQAALNHSLRMERIEQEWPGFVAGMLKRVLGGGRV